LAYPRLKVNSNEGKGSKKDKCLDNFNDFGAFSQYWQDIEEVKRSQETGKTFEGRGLAIAVFT
jgi:hypothetical protein